MSILGAGAQLQENLPGRVENKDVDCPVEQVIRMDLAAGRGPLRLVLLIDDRELLLECIVRPF